MPHPCPVRALLILLLWLAVQPAGADERPLLWQIDGPTPSYLFGTIHSAQPALNRLPEAVERAFAAADRFYAELALEPTEQARITQLFLLPDDDSLSHHLSQTQQRRAEAALRAIDPGLSLVRFERLKPWAFTLTLSLLEDQLAYADQPAMDLALYQRARARGLPRGGLESPEEQLGLFEQLSNDEQSALLNATLGYLEQSRRAGHSSMRDTYRRYAEGDPEQLLELFAEQMDVPLLLKLKLQQLLLTERNQRMAQRIERLLQQHPGDSFFFAVGAAHMASAQGLPALLRAAGYRVIRVAAE